MYYPSSENLPLYDIWRYADGGMMHENDKDAKAD